MTKPTGNQEDSEAPSFKDKLYSKLRTLKPSSALAKVAIVSSLSLIPAFGLGYLAVATKYPGSIDIQILNTLDLKVHNQGQ